jgi:membrane protein DedA with SNARE-associated domain
MPAVLLSVSGLVTDELTSLIGNHGFEAVFALMLIDALLPAFSELVMVYAGALAAGAFAHKVQVLGHPVESGGKAFLVMVAAGTIGYTIGAVVGWAIGLYGGRPFLERRGRWFHLSPEKLDRAERWFDRFGELATLIGRVTPVARSFVSIPAGVFRARLGTYVPLTFVGSTLWCLGFAGVGYALGTRWESFHDKFHYVDYAVVALAGGALILLILRRRNPSKLGGRRGEDPAH